MTAIKAREAGATYRVVRSNRERWCEDGHATYPYACVRKIQRGEQYVRAVMFPNHDVYSYVERGTGRPLNQPVVTVLCFECASGYHLTGLLVIDARRAPR